MVALLDVNVLVALFDPMHVHHEAAHEWFALNRKDRWATCPLTENAFVRVLSNPGYPGEVQRPTTRRRACEGSAQKTTMFFGRTRLVFVIGVDSDGAASKGIDS